MGEVADDDEKIISEAILAIPYYYNTDTQKVSFINLQADAEHLGPKIKEFRRTFANYSVPPSLRKSLTGLLPPDYPNVPNYINPFGGDELDEVLTGTDLAKVPVVYLLEHKISLSRQDLSDIWQGVMPDVGGRAQLSVSSIDHYMPGKRSYAGKRPVFDEVLEKQIDLGIERDGFPRVDLLDTTSFPDRNGFTPDIRWLIFKVKKRGQTDYTSMILSEINGGVDKKAFSAVFGHLANDLPPAQREELLKRKDDYTKGIYHSDKIGEGRNTYNWPYDYFSLIEMTKLTQKVGFRPDLELADVGEDAQETVRKKAAIKISKSLRLDPNMIGRQKNVGNLPAKSPPAPIQDLQLDVERIRQNQPLLAPLSVRPLPQATPQPVLPNLQTPLSPAPRINLNRQALRNLRPRLNAGANLQLRGNNDRRRGGNQGGGGFGGGGGGGFGGGGGY
jgi:uncharacterized membrane protein YgcG